MWVLAQGQALLTLSCPGPCDFPRCGIGADPGPQEAVRSGAGLGRHLDVPLVGPVLCPQLSPFNYDGGQVSLASWAPRELASRLS